MGDVNSKRDTMNPDHAESVRRLAERVVSCTRMDGPNGITVPSIADRLAAARLLLDLAEVETPAPDDDCVPDARTEPRYYHHTAMVMCGSCNHRVTIALGIASAIACPGCKTEIQIGEEDHTNEMIDAFREIVAVTDRENPSHVMAMVVVLNRIREIAERWSV